jgi:L-ascorbate metabolism protein UlaG (beta-lactamase superfamily)
MEKAKKQSSPVMGSTKKPEREHHHNEMVMPRIVQVGDVAYAQNKNNTRVIAAHYYGGLRESVDEVALTYYGMSAIKITTPKGLELFFDPWKNPCDPSWGGIWYSMRMPMTHCDIGFTTHSHFDHNAFEMLDASMILKNFVGEYNFADFKVTGIADKHIAQTQSAVYTKEVLEEIYPFPNVAWEDRDNTIYLIETGGLRIVHWGDNRQNPPQDVWDKLQNIDIAILPISDDGRTLTPEWADKIAKKMGAKVVIPTHYFLDGINIPNAGWEKSAIEYTQAREHTLLDTHTISLSSENIKEYNNHVMYFGENLPFEIENISLNDTNAAAKLPEVKAVWEQYK